MNFSKPDEQVGSFEAGWLGYCRIAVVVIFCAALAFYVAFSWRWPLIHDMQVIHYVSFLIDQGWAPYRQIGDMNMPGAYLIEGWALHLFGSSDVGWRLYDFSLSIVSIAAMYSIGRRYDRLAGLVAGATFVLIHASRGPMDAGQRDQTMAVLLIVGFAFCFESIRQSKPWLMFLFALSAGMAASIKPTLFVSGPIILVLAVVELRRRKVRAHSFVLWSIAGFSAAIAIVLAFLLWHRSMGAFWFDLTQIIPHYAGVTPATWTYLLGSTLQVSVVAFVGCAVVAAALDRNWWNWECIALLCGVFFGLINFYGQRKGFAQHRYTTIAFVVLWAMIQMFLSLRGRGYGRGFAVAGILFIVLVDIPHDLILVRQYKPYDDFLAYLESDLALIGTARLQGEVQCLDIIDGCLDALYHLKVVQSTGSTGDLLLFLPQSSWVVERARSTFLAEMQSDPPKYIVLSNATFNAPRSFRKVDTWPAFKAFLNQNYETVIQREFPNGAATSLPGTDPSYSAYRILKREEGSSSWVQQPRQTSGE